MTTEIAASLRDRYIEAIERAARRAPLSVLTRGEVADVVLHVRDAELARLQIQVADYERQLLALAAHRDRLRGVARSHAAQLLRIGFSDVDEGDRVRLIAVSLAREADALDHLLAAAGLEG